MTLAGKGLGERIFGGDGLGGGDLGGGVFSISGGNVLWGNFARGGGFGVGGGVFGLSGDVLGDQPGKEDALSVSLPASSKGPWVTSM